MDSGGVIPKRDLIEIRDSIEDDHAFIFSSFLKGLRYGNSFFGAADQASYFKAYHKILSRILEDFETTVKIACLRESPDVILGFCIYKNDRLDWIFVKARWRGIGIARDLTPAGIKTVSHLTPVGSAILRKHPGVKFNPFSIL